MLAPRPTRKSLDPDTPLACWVAQACPPAEPAVYVRIHVWVRVHIRSWHESPAVGRPHPSSSSALSDLFQPPECRPVGGAAVLTPPQPGSRAEPLTFPSWLCFSHLCHCWLQLPVAWAMSQGHPRSTCFCSHTAAKETGYYVPAGQACQRLPLLPRLTSACPGSRPRVVFAH